eukprot:CAMPEP_0170480260 /NCGR_PEP_ID=MMETSP0208-20121228/1170_1 /TAXON_ID=197538 /ORGANISM="Strombidium inclinatum, Strain S3" /LENGTH=144 /DNA_ID=CAMNT_0010752779 /DNA_START=83 /DNA_END=517 /DNA_ORIENTATION=+
MSKFNKSEITEQRFIVDRDITDNAIEGIFVTIQDAIDDAAKVFENNRIMGNPISLKIKIASNLYEENLRINVPGVILEPKEKGGEVTLQQDQQPCIVVDVPSGSSVTINNTRMLLRGGEVPKVRQPHVASKAEEAPLNKRRPGS